MNFRPADHEIRLNRRAPYFQTLYLRINKAISNELKLLINCSVLSLFSTVLLTDEWKNKKESHQGNSHEKKMEYTEYA